LADWGGWREIDVGPLSRLSPTLLGEMFQRDAEAAMSNTLESLQAQVAGLSVADRSRLLEHLIASLDVDHDLEAAWEAVADLREAEAASGRSTAVALGDALARLEARFPK